MVEHAGYASAGTEIERDAQHVAIPEIEIDAPPCQAEVGQLVEAGRIELVAEESKSVIVSWL